jgi:hypothetical protein
MLGLTIGCARCHDHKFDPVPTRDYYRMLCAFQTGERADVPLGGEKSTVGYIFRETTDKPVQGYLFHRADFYDKSEPVTLGFLTALTGSKSAESYLAEAKASGAAKKTTYQRAALARWITDVEHGAGALVARVIVNRVWRHHFGEGLVSTPSDFGTQGEEPSHPELLEWLADDFVRHGWRIKRLHRRIVTSAAYLQDSAPDEAKMKLDPDNRLLSRRRPVRLEAEVLRDSMLAVAGTLNLTPYGPAFKPPIAAEARVARNLKTPYNAEPADSPNIRRRSVYMFHKRVVPYPLLATFDKPDALQSCGRRDNTTVAPQSLAILNDPFVRERAGELAERLTREAGGDDTKFVTRAFLLCFARRPSETELRAATEFLASQRNQRTARDPKKSAAARREALTDFCQALFGLNEFLYVD